MHVNCEIARLQIEFSEVVELVIILRAAAGVWKTVIQSLIECVDWSENYMVKKYIPINRRNYVFLQRSAKQSSTFFLHINYRKKFLTYRSCIIIPNFEILKYIIYNRFTLRIVWLSVQQFIIAYNFIIWNTNIDLLTKYSETATRCRVVDTTPSITITHRNWKFPAF